MFHGPVHVFNVFLTPLNVNFDGKPDWRTQGVIVEQDKDEKVVVHNTDYFLFLKFNFVWN